MNRKRLLLWISLVTTLLLLGAAGALAFSIPNDSADVGAPGTLNYQGVLLDSAGNPVPDGNYSITFAVYDLATGGTSLWQETQIVAVADGLFNARLGAVNPIADTSWVDGRDLWLGITLSGEPEMEPRQQLVSVPYALNAGDVRNADIHPNTIYAGAYGLVIDADGFWHGQPFPEGRPARPAQPVQPARLAAQPARPVLPAQLARPAPLVLPV